MPDAVSSWPWLKRRNCPACGFLRHTPRGSDGTKAPEPEHPPGTWAVTALRGARAPQRDAGRAPRFAAVQTRTQLSPLPSSSITSIPKCPAASKRSFHVLTAEQTTSQTPTGPTRKQRQPSRQERKHPTVSPSHPKETSIPTTLFLSAAPALLPTSWGHRKSRSLRDPQASL